MDKSLFFWLTLYTFSWSEYTQSPPYMTAYSNAICVVLDISHDSSGYTATEGFPSSGFLGNHFEGVDCVS